MRNRDWVELLDTLGHDPALPFALTANTTAATDAAPFVFVGDDLATGAPKDLLFKMISAMGIRAEKVRIVSLNESPNAMATQNRQWIIALGPEALALIMRCPNSNESFEEMRGRLHRIDGASNVLATYHPALLLKFPDMKKACWDDLQLVMQDAGLSR